MNVATNLIYILFLLSLPAALNSASTNVKRGLLGARTLTPLREFYSADAEQKVVIEKLDIHLYARSEGSNYQLVYSFPSFSRSSSEICTAAITPDASRLFIATGSHSQIWYKQDDGTYQFRHVIGVNTFITPCNAVISNDGHIILLLNKFEGVASCKHISIIYQTDKGGWFKKDIEFHRSIKNFALSSDGLMLALAFEQEDPLEDNVIECYYTPKMVHFVDKERAGTHPPPIAFTIAKTLPETLCLSGESTTLTWGRTRARQIPKNPALGCRLL